MRASPSSDLRPPLSSNPEESEWVQAARAGSLAALDQLLRRHQPWIFNLALRMVWRREVAGFLSGLVVEHRLSKASAAEIASRLSYQAAKDAYRL